MENSQVLRAAREPEERHGKQDHSRIVDQIQSHLFSGRKPERMALWLVWSASSTFVHGNGQAQAQGKDWSNLDDRQVFRIDKVLLSMRRDE